MEDIDDKLELQDQEAAAIKALGSLFKLTEVQFWVNVSTGVSDGSTSMQHRPEMVQDDAICSSMSDGSSLPIDTELSRQMNELGLPLSFHTNKEKRNGKFRGKRKDTNKKFLHSDEGTLDKVLDSIKVSECEFASPAIIHNNLSNTSYSMSMPCHSESSSCGIAVGDNELQAACGEGEHSTALISAVSSSADMKHNLHNLHDLISDVWLTCAQECDSVSNTVLTRDNMKMETTFDHVDVGTSGDLLIIDNQGKTQQNEGLEENMGSLVGDLRFEDEEFCGNANIDLSQESGGGVHSQCCNDYDIVYGENNDQYGGWMMYWDSFYERNYFYNSKTQESTWEPPQSMGQLAFGDVIDESKEIVVDMSKIDVEADVTNHRKEQNMGVDLDLSDELGNGRLPCYEHIVGVGLSVDNSDNPVTASTTSCCSIHLNEPLEINKSGDESILFVSPHKLHPPSRLSCTPSDDICDELLTIKEHGGNIDSAPEKLDIKLDTIPKKKKSKVRRTSSWSRLCVDNEDVRFQVFLEEFSPCISKYWCQRYVLFSKFDDGVRMDKEGWFSVTPEPIAKHHALRCGSGIIVDSFTGVGGNAIQFAQMATHIIAIDIDPKKIEFARHNAAIYGVEDHIEFMIGDCFILSQKLKADTVFLSPPWGGPEYAKARNFDIKTMLKPYDGQFLFNVAKRIAPRIVMFLPRNVDINQLAELSLSANPPWSLEVEKNFVNGKVKAITAYFCHPSLCETSAGS